MGLSVGDAGDLVAWRAGPAPGVAPGEPATDRRWTDGELVVPPLGEAPVDPTGAGDVWVAVLIAGLLGAAGREDAAWVAAADTVAHAGGRPDLDPSTLAEEVRRHRR